MPILSPINSDPEIGQLDYLINAHEFEGPHFEDARGIVAEPRNELHFSVRSHDGDGIHLAADVLCPQPRFAPDNAVDGEGQLCPVVHVGEGFLQELQNKKGGISPE